mmetsp:Transcript_116512/g.334489  ORF Transcript_116512/g.334489 Transcript_116512/m.334489 type:complete len:222 (-) Transcript_116512:30-695(-)
MGFQLMVRGLLARLTVDDLNTKVDEDVHAMGWYPPGRREGYDVDVCVGLGIPKRVQRTIQVLVNLGIHLLQLAEAQVLNVPQHPHVLDWVGVAVDIVHHAGERLEVEGVVHQLVDQLLAVGGLFAALLEQGAKFLLVRREFRQEALATLIQELTEFVVAFCHLQRHLVARRIGREILAHHLEVLRELLHELPQALSHESCYEGVCHRRAAGENGCPPSASA